MSYDLAVFAPQALSPVDLGTLISELGLHLGADGPDSITVTRGARRRYSFTIDGPDRVEDEDVPDEVSRAVLGVQFRYSILVEGTADAEIPYAVRFARRLAAAVDGAVLDEQTDQVWTWAHRARAVERPERHSRVAVVDLEWYCLRKDLPDDVPRRFLTAVERCLPEALPRRYGEYEPLQGKYADAGADGFSAAWAGATGTLFTTGALPCVGGHLAAGPADRYAGPIWSASVSFLADPIAEPGWRTALQRLFVTLADALPAFCATAEVRRGYIWSGRSLWADAETEWTVNPSGRDGWLGLPPQPTWWIWLGPPYRNYAHLLPADNITPTANGVLYEAAATPAAADDLQPLTTFLPGTLFAVRTSNRQRELPIPARKATEIPAGLT